MLKLLLLLNLSFLALADVGQLSFVQGDTILVHNQHDIPLVEIVPLQVADSIITHEGRTQVSLSDNTQINLGRHSKISIVAYSYKKDKATNFLILKLSKGFFQTVTGDIASRHAATFLMQTNTTNIYAKNAIWNLSVENNSEHYYVIEGSLTLHLKGDSKREIHLNKGDSIVLHHQKNLNNSTTQTDTYTTSYLQKLAQEGATKQTNTKKMMDLADNHDLLKSFAPIPYFNDGKCEVIHEAFVTKELSLN